MIRPALTEIILFLAPFVLYAVFLWVTRTNAFDVQHWPLSRIISLAIISVVLILGSFIYFAHFEGAPPGSTYVPAHIEDGKFVPGTIK
ncbi:MAG TPA: DUF6111 family protein [Pseudolabrys sp.]|jgi:hypothetical protein|nr:DUF6111 family protein [Pseudolabrys sp.]